MKQTFRFILFFVLIASKGFSQTAKIDSLRKISYSNSSSTERLNGFLLLLTQSESMFLDSLSKVIQDASVLVKQENNPSASCKYVYSLARYYVRLGRIDTARILLNKAFEENKNVKGISRELLMIEFYLAKLRVREGKYKEGMAEAYLVLAKAENKKDYEVWSQIANLIGFSYMDMGRYEEAISWFYRILKVKLSPSEQYDQSQTFANLASCLNNVLKFDSALTLVNTGIERSRQEQNLTSLANGLNIKADILINLNQKEKAEPLLIEAISIRKKIGNANFVASDLAQLSMYYATVGKYDKGIKLADSALKIFNQNNLLSKSMFAYEALKTNYKYMGDNKNYAVVLEKMLSLKDSLYTTNSAEALTELQQKFEVEKKERTIAQQKLDLFQRNILLYGGGISVVILLGLLGYRFNKYKTAQKVKSIAQVKDAEEKERKRISSELHDNLGVQANAILHNSTLLKEKEYDNAIVTDLQETAKEMLVNLRETLWAMKTSDVSSTDLWLRIINFMKQMGRHYTAINFNISGSAPTGTTISSNKAINIILVIQESVNNAVKHSKGKNISVQSESSFGNWAIAISDDGVGFDENLAFIKKDSYGFANMKERAQTANFKYEIAANLGTGTATKITIPI